MNRHLWSLRSLACRHKLARPLWRLVELAFGSYVPTGVTFAGPPCFPHGMHSVFIAGAAKLGEDCVIFQQVTVGSNTLIDSKGYGAPVIGDRCYIGAGAKIIGGVKIGNDVRIGAGAVVTRDVPDNATVLASGEVRLSPTPKDNRHWHWTPAGWVFYRRGQWIRSDEPLKRAA